MPVDDVVVYKKSISKRMVGLRWNYTDDTRLDGFIVWTNKNDYANNTNISVIFPEKCSAWPEYYCHTFYNLSPNNNYTFKVQSNHSNKILMRKIGTLSSNSIGFCFQIKAKTQDYPEGGDGSSIFFNYTDGCELNDNYLLLLLLLLY